jgi:hypothetical protein
MGFDGKGLKCMRYYTIKRDYIVYNQQYTISEQALITITAVPLTS